jgi:hypothetical protein
MSAPEAREVHRHAFCFKMNV